MTQQTQSNTEFEGIIPVNKPEGITSFQLVRILRKHLGIQKIGHAGTLDPFATGVMVMLVGRKYTRLSDKLINEDKEYVGTILLGASTDTYDREGQITQQSDYIPGIEQIKEVLLQYDGDILQTPPMYSAKKIQGKKLYELARKGKEIHREPVPVKVKITLLNYTYPHLEIHVSCSKGTYIRSLAHDIGNTLGCCGHLITLKRTRSGTFDLGHCFEGKTLSSPEFNLKDLKKMIFDLDRIPLK